VDLNNGVYAAELWNPATGTWRTLAAEQATRQYHSTALLLPDGRVLSSGGGICGTCDQVGYLAKNAQVFSPPYLFAADGSPAVRPVIAGAPDTVNAGSTFTLDTPDAAAIAKVALVRLGAVTHSVNMEQRYVPLAFTRGSGSLTATAPENVNIAPPGVYMLFVVDAAGVPSIAKMVTVADAPAPPPPPPPPPNAPPTVSITQPLDGAVFPFKPTITVTASASDTAPGTVARVEFLRNGTLVATDASAPYSWTWKNAPQGTSTLTARATDNQGAQTTSAPVRISVNKR
jgi:hypothetical protein